MESSIHQAEAKVEAAQGRLLDPKIAADADELMKRQEAVDAAKAKVAALYQRWEELEQRANRRLKC